MKEIISSLWIGRPLSLIEQLSITSFLQNGHAYHLYCYEKIKNVPAGVILRDAAEILPTSEIFYYRHGAGKGSVSAFSNIFRYKLLLERGGWWVDTDVVCLQRFDFDGSVVFASERLRNGTQVTSAVIKLPQDHCVARQCYEIARRENPAKLRWGKTGPVLLNRIVRENSLQHFVQPPGVFCPLDYWQWKTLLEKTVGTTESLFTGESCAIHLWHEMWRRSGVKMNPTMSESPVVNFFKDLWRQACRKPKLTFDEASPFAKLLHQYGLKNESRIFSFNS